MTRSEFTAEHLATLRASVAGGEEDHADIAFKRVVYAALATPDCEAQGVRLVDMPHLAERVAEMADAHEWVVGERHAYHAFAVTVARHLAAPGAEDMADKLAPGDLLALLDRVCGEYGNGRAAGDRARFARCVTDLTRALGGDERRPLEWDTLIESVRAAVAENSAFRAERDALRAERDAARAEVGRLAARDGLAAAWCPTDGSELTSYGCCDVCGYEDRLGFGMRAAAGVKS